jgi:hypothetical protein
MSTNYPEICGRYQAIASVAVLELEKGAPDPEMVVRLRRELDAALTEPVVLS